MAFFKYIFFRIFISYRKKHDEIESAITAMIFVSLFMFMNIFSLGGLLNNFELLPVFFKSKLQVTSFIIVLFFVNFYIFLYKKKYKIIYERFTNSRNIKGNRWFVILYLIISVLLLLVTPFIKC